VNARKIRFGVVGSNFITDRIIAAGRMDPRFSLEGVCSRTAARAAEYSALHGIPRQFTSLEQMAASPDIDAVYIASPNALHAPQSIVCLEAGKHVLCEKPLASNAREAREMMAAARRGGATLMEAMKPTLTPNFQVVREFLPSLGAIRRYFAAFGKYSSRYDDLKVAAGAGSVGSVGGAGSAWGIPGSVGSAGVTGGTPGLPNAFNPALANGAAMDIGVYAIYPMVALFGAPDEVNSTVLMLPSGVDGHGAINFSYRHNGMIATALYSKMVDMALPWEIEGEAATLRGNAINTIARIEFRTRGDSEGGGKGYSSEGGWRDISAPGHCGNDYFYEIAHFIDLIEARQIESPINSHAVSIATLEIIDELRRQNKIVYPAD
jgi:predicted dehydrogenase